MYWSLLLTVMCSGRCWFTGVGGGVAERWRPKRRSAHSPGRRPACTSSRNSAVRQPPSTGVLCSDLRLRRRRRQRVKNSRPSRPLGAAASRQRVLRRAVQAADAPRRRTSELPAAVDVRGAVDVRRTSTRGLGTGRIADSTEWEPNDDAAAGSRVYVMQTKLMYLIRAWMSPRK